MLRPDAPQRPPPGHPPQSAPLDITLLMIHRIIPSRSTIRCTVRDRMPLVADRVADVADRVADVCLTCGWRDCNGLQALMAVVLALGNTLNNAKAPVSGFRIDSLQKLVDTRRWG